MKTHLEVGQWGEDIAVAILQLSAYQLLTRNWRPRLERGDKRVRGEIDAVMLDPEGELVFVEVKTRSTLNFGSPFDAIQQEKVQRIKRLAYAWCSENPDYRARSLRMDAVSICGTPTNFTYEHLKAVN